VIPTAPSTSAAEEQWDSAEGALRGVLQHSGLNFNEEPGEAAFYGPKADFMVRDCIGRSWQLGTVQLITTCPSGSSWNTTAPTTRRTVR
jgi:threonyl-tRNA synthetase